MGLTLLYITNQEHIAKIAEKCGVDWIFVDLEIIGKKERQGKFDTVISNHRIDDVIRIKKVLRTSELLVRVNPIYRDSRNEIRRVINNGADIVMLPFFKTLSEVETFIRYVNGQAKTCLLLETPEAVDILDSILNVYGIDYIQIGLNDLHLAYKMKFMFELLADGTVERLCKKIREKNIMYGFGGVAQLGKGILSSENILAEHYRLGSSMVILSRSFCNVFSMSDESEIKKIFNRGITEIRNFETNLLRQTDNFFFENKTNVAQRVSEITHKLESMQSIK